jgi:hypothetical protein
MLYVYTNIQIFTLREYRVLFYFRVTIVSQLEFLLVAIGLNFGLALRV